MVKVVEIADPLEGRSKVVTDNVHLWASTPLLITQVIPFCSFCWISVQGIGQARGKVGPVIMGGRYLWATVAGEFDCTVV